MENKTTTNQAKSVIEATSGHTGKLKWSINGTTLTIKGKGRISNYDYHIDPIAAYEFFGFSYPDPDYNLMPWYFHRKEIYEVIIEEGVTIIGEGAFADCSNLISVTIPDSVTKIESHAFSRCNSLGFVTIPGSITNIKFLAFGCCTDLKHIDLLSKKPPVRDCDVFNYDAFNSIEDTCILHVPIGSKKEYAQAEGWEAFKNIQEDIL